MKEKFKKFNTLFIVLITSFSVCACVINTPVNTKINLTTIISITNLGSIFMIDKIPSKVELFNGIKKSNQAASKLTINDFTLQDVPKENNATIVGIGNYNGKINFQYNKSKIDLNDLITNTNLNKFNIKNMIPTKNILLKLIKAINNKAWFLKLEDFGFEDQPTQTSATIVGLNYYTGQVKLTY